VDRLIYLFKTFIVIGSTSFGGYMALIAVMRNRMVLRDKSIDDNLITEGVSLASMLPGPVAVNVVAYTGFHLAGIAGAVISVVSVLLPSFLLVLFLTYVFIQAGDRAWIDDVLLGIFPVVAAVIFSTGISMAKKTCTTLSQICIAAVSFVLLIVFKGYWIILLVLIMAGTTGYFLFRDQVKVLTVSVKRPWRGILLPLGIYGVILTGIIVMGSGSVLATLFVQFSSASLTLFGGGYVMVPILKSILIDQLNWFNDQEFIYGISIGQVTPGPILISSVFFGYMMAGIAGAVIATIGIFFPSGMLMIILSNLFTSLKHSRVIQAALMGLKPAVTGMILYSGVSIFSQQVDKGNLLVSLLITAVAFWLVFRFNLSSSLVIIGGGVLGLIIY
jgi:chromate transporter